MLDRSRLSMLSAAVASWVGAESELAQRDTHESKRRSAHYGLLVGRQSSIETVRNPETVTLPSRWMISSAAGSAAKSDGL